MRIILGKKFLDVVNRAYLIDRKRVHMAPCNARIALLASRAVADGELDFVSEWVYFADKSIT